MMKPIDKDTPKDRMLLLWFPCPGGGLSYGKWDAQPHSKSPRPHWHSYDLSAKLGMRFMYSNPPTHWSEVPTSPDQVTIEVTND